MEQFKQHAIHLCRDECAKAAQLQATGKLPHSRLHAKAVDIADSYLAVQKGLKGSAGEAAKAQTAADAAAAINDMPRCNKCEACIHTMTSTTRRRCLRVRAFAAAAGGHTGAQIAVMEKAALGAKLKVCFSACCRVETLAAPCCSRPTRSLHTPMQLHACMPQTHGFIVICSCSIR